MYTPSWNIPMTDAITIATAKMDMNAIMNIESFQNLLTRLSNSPTNDFRISTFPFQNHPDALCDTLTYP